MKKLLLSTLLLLISLSAVAAQHVALEVDNRTDKLIFLQFERHNKHGCTGNECRFNSIEVVTRAVSGKQRCSTVAAMGENDCIYLTKIFQENSVAPVEGLSLPYLFQTKNMIYSPPLLKLVVTENDGYLDATLKA